jgi:hypothetical protein
MAIITLTKRIKNNIKRHLHHDREESKTSEWPYKADIYVQRGDEIWKNPAFIIGVEGQPDVIAKERSVI